MGVFAVIGLVILLIGLSGRNGKIVLTGAMVMGIGIAGDINGY